MIQHHSILAGWFLLVVACPAATPPPPNDRFVDRIVLSGSSINFTGTLAGATRDSIDEAFGYPYAYGCCANHSVWWSWTAAETKAVTIQAIDQWPVSFVAANYSDLLVYSNSPASGFPTNDPLHTPPVTGVWMYSPLAPSCSFVAEAGREYFIQLHSGEGYYVTNDYAFNLTATNPPILLRLPKSVTATADASALFTVVALGVRPLGYQWRFNGVDMPGRTFPMLPLDGLSASNAGDYTVVVSNLTGMNTSAVATLAVSSTWASPLLTARGTDGGRFEFLLSAELGRNYRIESTTNLLNWSPERSFPAQCKLLTSVVFTTNATAPFSLPLGSDSKFFRASSYNPSNEVCNNILKRFRHAQEMWVREFKRASTSTPTIPDLQPYYDGNIQLRRCPSGGITVPTTLVNGNPTCTIPGHVLEEQP